VGPVDPVAPVAPVAPVEPFGPVGRLEACYELASRLRLKGRYRTAHALLGGVVDAPEPDDLLFTKSWVYEWGLLFEFSITAYWVGDYTASIEACDTLLGLPDLPEPIRRQTVLNREFAVGQAVAAVPGPSGGRHGREQTTVTRVNEA
jgi:hypothetical protein